jgi:pyruvate formate lyase activating enzyme
MSGNMLPREARYYKTEDDKIRCILCPHHCLIREGETGICRVRRNMQGKLYSEIYGKLSALNFDPIEKKPLYHFFPGSVILSIGSVGCNMHCRCCQNWQISQTSVEDFPFRNYYEAEDLLTIAKSRKENTGIAYTYNEPTVWFEYMYDTARQVQAAGMKNVMVSNGFIQPEPLVELLPYMDAFNIDLKAFSVGFYRKVAGASLDPVLDTLKKIVQSGKHLEITNLVIPTLNDNEREFTEMVKWIVDELGQDTVLHLSRYHPMYRMEIGATDADTLKRLARIASDYLSYVYVGNIEISGYRNTRCRSCGTTVIERTGYDTEIIAIDHSGKCVKCGHKIVYQ